MSRFLLTSIFLVACLRSFAAAPITVMADTNGTLRTPIAFFTNNAHQLSNLVSTAGFTLQSYVDAQDATVYAVALSGVNSANAAQSTANAANNTANAAVSAASKKTTEGLVTAGQGNWFSIAGSSIPICGRAAVYARTDATGIRLHFTGFQNSTGAPGVTTNNQPIRVSIQLADGSGNPTGTPIPVYFDGYRVGYINSGTVLASDPSITVTNSQKLFILVWQAANNTGVYWGNRYLGGGAGEDFATTDLTDSGSGFSADDVSGNQNVLMPAMITGTVNVTNKLGVAIIGDSIAVGEAGNYGGNMSFANQAIGATRPYVNCSMGGSSANNWASMSVSWPAYLPLRYCSSAYVEPGFNDAVISQTAAQITNSIGGIINICRAGGIQWITGSTIKPKTTSTDGFITTANQTESSWNAVRASVNAWVRTNSVFNAYFDLALATQDSTLTNRNATGPAATIYTGTAAASSATYIARSTSTASNWQGTTIFANGGSTAVTFARASNYAWIGFTHQIPTSLNSGDTFTIYSSWTGDGTHPNGLGNIYIASQMNVSTLFP